MKIIPNFVVFEGIDGSGTTTQMLLLEDHFKKISSPAFFPTFEPTKGPIGKVIRSALGKEINLKAKSLAMLFAADRNEHLYGPNGVVERCARGELVVCDRYVLSSLVYQGLDCDDEIPWMLNAAFPAPEQLFFFDLDSKLSIKRLESRGKTEIFEYPEFQAKAREKYLDLLEMYKDSDMKITILDASKSKEEVFSQIWSVLSELPIIKQNELIL